MPSGADDRTAESAGLRSGAEARMGAQAVAGGLQDAPAAEADEGWEMSTLVELASMVWTLVWVLGGVGYVVAMHAYDNLVGRDQL